MIRSLVAFYVFVSFSTASDLNQVCSVKKIFYNSLKIKWISIKFRKFQTFFSFYHLCVPSENKKTILFQETPYNNVEKKVKPLQGALGFVASLSNIPV